MRGALTAVLLLLTLALPAIASAADPPPGSTWREEYLTSADGTSLHADVLRPKGVADSTPTPVLMIVSPYVGHSGATPTEFNPGARGPSDRFYDFYKLASIFERGYTVVQVDLRGYGGSGGCGDWGGPGEQADVKAAVEWAAEQKWSNGRVGMYGKSYDGWTGIMGLATRPKGLAAVVSQEPVVDGYRYIYMNGVHYSNTVASSQSFSVSPVRPGSTTGDSPDYVLSDATPNAGCASTPADLVQEAAPDPTVPFWAARNLLPKVKGASIPLFLFYGFLEDNTKPDHVFDVWNTVTGPKRGWFGQWDHIRGTDGEPGKALAGRNGFAAEAARFLDHYVKGLPLAQAAVDRDAPVAIQRENGSWRRESAWPPADAKPWTLSLAPGSYDDTGSNSSAGAPAGGVFTVTPKLPHDVHIVGVPKLTVELAAAAPLANVNAVLYDVTAAGKAAIVSRGVAALPASGGEGGGTVLSFELYAQDWKLAAGHQLVLHIADNDAGWLQTVPTNATIDIESGSLVLPALGLERAVDLDGAKSKIQPKFAAAQIGASILAKTVATKFPPAMKVPEVPAPPVVNPTILPELTVLAKAKGRRVVVTGHATGSAQISLRLMRGTKTVARKRATVRDQKFRATFKVSRAGRYRVAAADSLGTAARSRAVRVRR